MAHRRRAEQDCTAPGLLDTFARRLPEDVHLLEALFGREVVGRVVSRQTKDWNIPLRPGEMKRRDHTVIDAELWITHQLRDETHLAGVLAAGFSQLNVNVKVVGIPKEIWENRV